MVEIGSFRGRSTVVIAQAVSDGVEVVAIDPHAGGDRGPQEIEAERGRGEADYDAFRANLERLGVASRVRHVRLASCEAHGEVPGPIDALYVDGAHRYAPARADLENWGAHVRMGGTMLVHDAYNAVGVTLAQLRLLFLSRKWSYQGRTRSLAEYRRERLRGRQMATNALRQTVELRYFVRNGLIKLAMLAGQRRLARALGLPEGDDWPY